MLKIERLNKTFMNKARLSLGDARGMHVVSDCQINLPLPMKRYNYRTSDGIIQKYTLGDNFVSVSELKKVDNKYVKTLKRFLGSI